MFCYSIEKIIPTLHPERSSDNFNAYNHLIPPAIFLTVFMISVVLLSVALNRQFCGLKSKNHLTFLKRSSIPKFYVKIYALPYKSYILINSSLYTKPSSLI